jgi:5,10-methylene-tetrahydrofolate dehydrogenase/methenyl tetrahydrofolate cyclohydrolase
MSESHSTNAKTVAEKQADNDLEHVRLRKLHDEYRTPKLALFTQEQNAATALKALKKAREAEQLGQLNLILLSKQSEQISDLDLTVTSIDSSLSSRVNKRSFYWNSVI